MQYLSSFKFAIQVFDGECWLFSKYGANTLEDAKKEEKKLLNNTNAWVNPKAPKRTRIVEKGS